MFHHLLVPRIIFHRIFRKIKTFSTSLQSTNQLIKTLTHQKNYNRAFQLFDQLIQQNNLNIISLLNIINTCTQSGQIERTKQIENYINQSQQWKDNIHLQTSLINMHMKCQRIDHAEQIFKKLRLLPQCDIVVYNAMLKGYLENHQAEQCLEYFDEISSPDYVTYILLLNACSILRDEKRGIIIHKKVKHIQYVNLQNALIEFYGRINRIDISEMIFNDMNIRETSSFNSLMKAFLINNMPLKILELFQQMKGNSKDNFHHLLIFRPDLITFMVVCDACEQLGLMNNPNSSYREFNWKKIFSKNI